MFIQSLLEEKVDIVIMLSYCNAREREREREREKEVGGGWERGEEIK